MYPFVEKTKEGSVAHVYADKQCRDPGNGRISGICRSRCYQWTAWVFYFRAAGTGSKRGSGTGENGAENSDFQLPAKKITVNLSPAGRRKEGTVFDLPIAAAVLGAFELLSAEKLKDALLIGELGLDGSVKPVRGVLVLVSGCKKEWDLGGAFYRWRMYQRELW